MTADMHTEVRVWHTGINMKLMCISQAKNRAGDPSMHGIAARAASVRSRV